jgi:hypothetical protein
MTHANTQSTTISNLSVQPREPLSAADLEAIVGGQWDFTPSLTTAYQTGGSGHSGVVMTTVR